MLMKRSAFSLLELAISLLVVGIVAGVALSLRQSSDNSECLIETKLQLETIQSALDRFITANDRMPMPASRLVGVESPTFGREPKTPAELTAARLDSASGVTFGALPFQALGLQPSYAGDCWGNKFTYGVTTALTSSSPTGGFLDPTVSGAITVKSDTATVLTSQIAYVVLSHGRDAIGAVKTNYQHGSDKKWCAPSASPQSTNCTKDASGTPAADFSTVMSTKFSDGDNIAAAFDDLVLFKGKPIPAVAASDECPLCWFIYFIASH